MSKPDVVRYATYNMPVVSSPLINQLYPGMTQLVGARDYDDLAAERDELLGLLRDVREKACYSVGEAEELSRQMHLIRETIDATLAKHSA